MIGNTIFSKPPEYSAPQLSKRFVLFSVILFFIIILIGGAVFMLSMRQIVRTNKSNELSQMMEVDRLKLEASVLSEIAVVRKLADSPLIKKYFLYPDDKDLEAIAFEEIAGYRRAFSEFSILWIIDKDRMLYLDDNDPYWINGDAPENYWYNMTLYETEVFNFNINYNPDIQTSKLWINAPVFDGEGNPVGMVGTGYELSAYYAAIYREIGSNTSFYIFNGNGEITGARDVELAVAKKPIVEELGEIGLEVFLTAKSLNPNEVKTFEAASHKIAVGVVPALGWYTVAIAPIGLSDYNITMTALFFVMIVVIALILFISNLFISRISKSLYETMGSLGKALKFKREFLAKMSHEIRTPMNAVTGMAELALREDLTAAAREHVLTIKQAGANLLSIINDILDFSKIESGKLEIVADDYTLSSLLNDVIGIIRMRIAEAQVRFLVNVDGNIPNNLFGDVARIRQIMLNILGNAAKYTEKGFIALTVTGQTRNDDILLLKIEVSDSGRGIKQEDLERLFDDFVRFDLRDNRNVEGSGLGLAITHSLVKAMDGDIGVSSVFGEGSVFTVTLPQTVIGGNKIAAIDKPEEKKCLIFERRELCIKSIKTTLDGLGVIYKIVSTESEFFEEVMGNQYPFVFVASVLYGRVKAKYVSFKSEAQFLLVAQFGEVIPERDVSVIFTPIFSVPVANFLNGVSDYFGHQSTPGFVFDFTAPGADILVVDDIETNLQVARGLLSPYGMRIKLCLSGKEAILAIAQRRYDLVFMDHMMPEMDGVETVSRIRAFAGDPYYKKLPIVALTANVVSEAIKMLLNSGFNDFLSKPIGVGELDAILKKWIPEEKQIKKTLENNAGQSAPPPDDHNMEIDGLDIDKGIIMTGGAVENYKRTLAVFTWDGLKKTDEIKKSLESDNLSLYTTHVHALKSAAANIGANELSNMAKELEMAGNQGDLQFIQAKNDALLSALELLIDKIRNALKTDSFEKQIEPVDAALLQDGLIKLKTAIDDINPGQINAAVNFLKQFETEPGCVNKIGTIIQNTLVGEYDEALTAIHDLLQS